MRASYQKPAVSHHRLTGLRENGFNAWDRIVGTEHEKHWHRFVDVRNSEAFEMRRRQIARETEDRKILAAAPWYVGKPLEMIAGAIDLPTLLPIGRIYRTAEGGISLLKTGGSFAAEGAIQAAVQEGVLHSIQSTRRPEESVEKIVTAAGTNIIGGPIVNKVTGPALDKTSRVVRSGVQRCWEPERKKASRDVGSLRLATNAKSYLTCERAEATRNRPGQITVRPPKMESTRRAHQEYELP
jgi:hypothetical protein